jgi:transcriptional regulator with XRE-family HTH domain
MSQAELAQRAGLKAPAISQYESGQRSPSFESLLKLSSALGIPSDYLLKGEEIASSEGGDALSKLITHIAGLLTFDKREVLLDYALLLLEGGKKRLNVPYYTDVRSYADYAFGQESDGELPVNLDRILEQFQVQVYEAELEQGEGLLVKGQQRMIILDPKQQNLQRRRFTTATLIGHLLIPWHMDTVYYARSGSSFKTRDTLAMEATHFAACLLMPRDILKRDLQASSVSLEVLQILAVEKYDVSVFAMANSLVDLYPDRFAVVQSDGNNIMKTFQGQRPIKKVIDPRSLAAGFYRTLPNKSEIRTTKLDESIWFKDGRPGAFVLEESIYDPTLGTVLTLLTVI